MTTDSSEFTPRRGSHHTIADPVARPDAIEAEALALLTVGTGALVLNPVGKVQFAIVVPQTGGGAAGGALTVSAAVEELPVLVVPMKRLFETLLYVPAVGAVTLRLIRHVLFAATVTPETEIEPAPATGAKVGVPQPLVAAPVGLATTIAPGEVGKVSVKLTLLTATGLGLVIVKLSADEPLALIGVGLKLLLMVTAAGS